MTPLHFRTERLQLREFTAQDWPAVLTYHQDPRYLRFYPEEQGSEAEVRALVERFIEWQHERPRCRFQWAVLHPADEGLIGNCGIRKPSPEAREAEIGFELCPVHWGLGYATELARMLLRFGFEQLGVDQITARCLVENTASAHVLEKVGMVQIRRIPDGEWMRGRTWDALTYGITAPTWRAAQAPPA